MEREVTFTTKDVKIEQGAKLKIVNSNIEY